MPGFSISLFLLPRASESTGYKTDELLSLLDAPGDAPGWSWHSKSEPGVYTPVAASGAVEEVAHTSGTSIAREFLDKHA